MGALLLPQRGEVLHSFEAKVFFGPLLGLNPKLKTLNPKYRFGVPASGFRLSSGFRDPKPKP